MEIRKTVRDATLGLTFGLTIATYVMLPIGLSLNPSNHIPYEEVHYEFQHVYSQYDIRPMISGVTTAAPYTFSTSAQNFVL